MALPNVAVLLAAYQGLLWIEEQVQSILMQQGVNVTLFVSVDRCDDGTYEWVQEASNRDSRIQLLPYGERFGGAGANFFRLLNDVDLASFDYMAFADQDDIWLLGKLQRAVSKLADESAQVYSSNVMAFWPDGRQCLIKKSFAQRQQDHWFEAAGPGCTYVFRQNAALELQQFVRSHETVLKTITLHDWFAYAFCRAKGMSWFIDDQALMLYRQHEHNQVGVNQGWKAYVKRLSLVFNSSYRQQVEAISGLLNPIEASNLKRYGWRLRHFGAFRRRPRDRFVLLLMFLLCIY